MDLKTLSVIGHLFGVALGAGGAYMSDLMFFSSIRDQVISRTELRFLKLGSFAVWSGLAVLVITGTIIFLLDPVYYLASSKFMSKITIVGVILLNGVFFHRYHIPRMERHTGHHLPSSDEFMRRAPLLLMSGAVSFTSWSSALVLGALPAVPLAYWQIMLIYVFCLAVAMTVAYIARRKIIK